MDNAYHHPFLLPSCLATSLLQILEAMQTISTTCCTSKNTDHHPPNPTPHHSSPTPHPKASPTSSRPPRPPTTTATLTSPIWTTKTHSWLLEVMQTKCTTCCTSIPAFTHPQCIGGWARWGSTCVSSNLLWGSKLLHACRKLLGNYFSGHPGNFGFYYLYHYLPKIPGELFFGPSR